MKKKMLVLGLAGFLALVALALSRCLAGSPPVVRWRLGQTVASLPPPPSGAVLLHQGDEFCGGVSTVAYRQVQLYGTDDALEAVLDYYRPRLAAQGWQLLSDYGSPPDYSVGFVRAAKVAGISGGEYVAAHLFPEQVPPEAARFRTLYALDVTRTDGPAGIELGTPQEQESTSPGTALLPGSRWRAEGELGPGGTDPRRRKRDSSRR